LEFMQQNFLTLWRLLSKPGVETKELQQQLIGEVLPELPPKLADFLPDYPGVKIRNIFQTDLQTLSEVVIEDVARSRDLEERFLEECYSPSGALSQYSLISRRILRARYAALFDSEVPGRTTVAAVDREGVSAELLAESLSRRPILLIGDVGVGKTMFIQHLMKVDAPALFEDAITLYIDLGTQANLAADLRAFIVDELARQLISEYEVNIEQANFVRAVYNRDIELFEQSIYGRLKDSNPDLYLERNSLSRREDTEPRTASEKFDTLRSEGP
jgi:hypothetical protein